MREVTVTVTAKCSGKKNRSEGQHRWWSAVYYTSGSEADWHEELTHLKRPWCWERLKGEEKGITEDELFGWHHQLFSQGPRPTFVKTLYTLSVLLKPTSPNSLNLAWKVLKGDTIRLQPWFIIRRVSGLYIVDYTNGCHKDHKGDRLHRGLSHSFWQWVILVWNLVFISPGGQFAIGMLSPWLPGT